MKVEINIPQKLEDKYNKSIKIKTREEIYNLEEVQAIKGATQEHLLFIGMDNQNNIKDVSILGIGTGNAITIDPKFIIRNALVNSCERVVLVHNHTSNTLKASKEDRLMSNIVNSLLKCFNIELLDHLIVTENGYKGIEIDYDYEFKRLETFNKTVVENENYELKKENEILKNQLKDYKEIFEKIEGKNVMIDEKTGELEMEENDETEEEYY